MGSRDGGESAVVFGQLAYINFAVPNATTRNHQAIHQQNLLGLTTISPISSLPHPLAHLFVLTSTITSLTDLIIGRCPSTLTDLLPVSGPFGSGEHTHTWIRDELVCNVWP
jgi:hypothetical protein